MSEHEKPIGVSRSIVEFLQELGHGGAVADMSSELSEDSEE